MSAAPDVAGLWSALAKLPDRSAADRAADKQAAAARRVAGAMAAGRRYRTRSVPNRAVAMPVYRPRPRCDRGHFVQADRQCRVCDAMANGPMEWSA